MPIYYTLPEFLQELSVTERKAFACAICNGSSSHLSQLRTGRRRLSPAAAIKAEQVAREMGYDLPRAKLRPDIWGK